MRNFLFMLCFLVLVMSGFSYAADVVVERPTYSAGDYWIFVVKDGEEEKIEFVREGKDHYVFSKDGTQFIVDFNFTPVKDNAPIIQFPLKVGKWWDYEYEKKGDAIPKISTRRVARYEVVAYEQITVPAGTFWAFKIDSQSNIALEASKKRVPVGSAHYWYAPDVKQIIKSTKPGKGLKEFKIK